MKRFLAFLSLFLSVAILSAQSDPPTVRSDSGQAEFRGVDLYVVVALLADYEKTLRDWDRPDSAGMPQIQTRTQYVSGDTIVPFVAFASRKDVETPLLVDADLVMPDGSLSASDHSPGVVLASRVRGDGNLYREENVFGFGISKRYPPGHYVVRLKIYNDAMVFCVVEEGFQLN